MSAPREANSSSVASGAERTAPSSCTIRRWRLLACAAGAATAAARSTARVIVSRFITHKGSGGTGRGALLGSSFKQHRPRESCGAAEHEYLADHPATIRLES